VPIEGVEIEPFVLIQFANGQNRQVIHSLDSADVLGWKASSWRGDGRVDRQQGEEENVLGNVCAKVNF
jgi:hypothetical protein